MAMPQPAATFISGITAANKPLSMGVRIEVVGYTGVAEALKQLNRLMWLHDGLPSGQRLKWHKKRYDHFLKPSQLRHRRDRTIDRKKKHDARFPALDGSEWGCVEEDL